MNKTLLASALGLVCAAGVCSTASAARLTMINGDAGTSVGLNDPATATPVGGNPGRSVGEQRRIAYQFAMDMWGAVLSSAVEIKVGASFAPLTCTASGGVLGSAGPNWIDHDFPNAPIAGLWYHSALADSLAGVDLDPDPLDPADIVSRFNGDLGKPDCLAGSSWYYGLDGNAPAGSINFLNVVMHEIGHGLGVSGFLNKTTGAFNDYDGTGPRSDTYTQNAFDNVGNLGFNDPAMTAAQRATTMKTPGRLVWSGAQVSAQAPAVLDRNTVLRVTAPAAAAGNYEVGFASFGPIANASNFPSNTLVLIDDGVGAVADGCDPVFVNAAAVAGKVAVIDRGTCGFAVKVKNAQNNGAVGVVVANSAAPFGGMGGTDASITIPSVMVTQANGALIKANLPAQAQVAIDPTRLQGADGSGRVRLYSPTVVAGGSTFSHFDTSLTPNALMEPNASDDLESQIDVDLTPGLFTDIGWRLNPGNATIAGCDTTVDAVEVGGLIPGANITAQSNMCAASARGSRASYLRCVSDQATKLQQMGAITSAQNMKIRQCASLVRP